MSLTDFQKLFKNTLLKITDDVDDIYVEYMFARTDEVRQEIIDGINNGSIKSLDDIYAITEKMSPVYKYEQMKKIIKNILQRIEKENDIKFLFAVENGSRSWGMASKDSDYDVRFVFYRKADNYISLNPEKEVITAAYDKYLSPCDVQGSLIDMSGFDIFKYLKLLSAGNPTTIEWLNSPMVYYGDNNFSLRDYMKNNFNQERLFKHYR